MERHCAKTKAEKIVVVAEKDEAIRRTIAAALSRVATRVIQTEDGTGALAVTRAHRPDLLILGAGVPGLDGAEVCRALKADPDTAGTQVLLFNGREDARAVIARGRKLLGAARPRQPRPGAMRMSRVCAWCGKNLGDGAPSAEPVVTHGICPDCAFDVNSRLGLEMREFLECLPQPVIVIDPDTKVAQANKAARDMLGEDAPRLRGKRPGQLFECRNAVLQGGCGKTVHCGGCALRTTVEETLRTGRSRRSVPAYVNAKDRQVVLNISTERLGKVVLLRVDEIKEA